MLMHLKQLTPWFCVISSRYFNVAIGTHHFRQKIAYKTRYHWLLDLKKVKARARYPWIPREPQTTVEIDGQTIELPERNLEFIVPKDLNTCNLKPYVFWRSKVVGEGPLTAETLFEKKYASKVRKMHEDGADTETIIKDL